MQKCKAAIVLPYFGPGGAEKMVSQLAAGMDQTRFEPKVFCIYGNPQNNHLEQALHKRGIPIHYIGKKKGFSFSAIVKLFRALDAFSPDVVHTHLYACVYTALWPVIRRKSFLHTFHTLPEVENRRPVRRLLTSWLIHHGKMTPVAISAGNRKRISDFYRIEKDCVPMVCNPVDMERFSKTEHRPDGEFRFITVGRLSDVKNQQMMLRAFAAFLAKGHEAKLQVLGRGEEEENLKALSEELGIRERVEFVGYVANVEDYLMHSDVFLLSSRYEAQPLSILEAMAAGLPVISTDVGGVSDIVTDNGILIPADDGDALTRAMEMLYTQPLLRAEMSARAKKNVQRYDLTNTVAGYQNLYLSHISNK